MSSGGVGGADGAGKSSGAGGVDSVGGSEDGISESEASGIANDAVSASDNAAAAVGESIANSNVTDTVEVSERSRSLAADTAQAAAVEAPVEEPGLLEGAANWAGQTAKGYATGAVNGVLDLANVVNMGTNAALNGAGVDYQFQTDMHVAPTSQTEKHAQDALAVASLVAGGVGLVRAAPAIAKGLDDAAGMFRSGPTKVNTPGPGTPPNAAVNAAQPAAHAARLGDLRPNEMARIQAAADQLGEDLYVVGSAAKGARRNVDTDLPLAEFGGTKAGTRSDIDYAIRNGADDAASELDLPDMDDSWGVRGVDYLNLDNSPAIRFSPGRAPEMLDGGGRLNLN